MGSHTYYDVATCQYLESIDAMDTTYDSQTGYTKVVTFGRTNNDAFNSLNNPGNCQSKIFMTEHVLGFEDTSTYDASLFSFRKVYSDPNYFTNLDIVEWISYTPKTNFPVLASY
jgi:hypothetical protein